MLSRIRVPTGKPTEALLTLAEKQAINVAAAATGPKLGLDPES